MANMDDAHGITGMKYSIPSKNDDPVSILDLTPFAFLC